MALNSMTFPYWGYSFGAEEKKRGASEWNKNVLRNLDIVVVGYTTGLMGRPESSGVYALVEWSTDYIIGAVHVKRKGKRKGKCRSKVVGALMNRWTKEVIISFDYSDLGAFTCFHIPGVV